MSDNVLYTLLVIGFFALFYLLIILPGQLRAKRKRYKQESEYKKPADWMTDPGDPLWQENIGKDLSRKW